MTDARRRQRQVEWITTYFDHDAARHALQHSELDQIFDVNPVAAPPVASQLQDDPKQLPTRFRLPATTARYLGVPALAIDRDQLLALLGTRGLLVLHGSRVVHEEYLLGHRSDVRWMTNSASKLVVAMLVARARADGLLGDLDEPIRSYWPEVNGTAWEPVTLGQCLSMTTGIDFVEESLDLLDPATPFVALFRELALGSVEKYMLGLGRRSAPGTDLTYSSIDAEALGSTLIRAVRKGIAAYLEETIWRPAGMERDAFWLCDPTGRELALSGLCATLRDYGRLGLVLSNDGNWNGVHVLPAEFSAQLRRPDPAVFGKPGHDDYPLLCWQQSFVPSRVEEQDGDYMAAGSYGQLIYVHPSCDVVIAHQGIGRDITTEYIDMHRAFMAFRQMAHHLAEH